MSPSIEIYNLHNYLATIYTYPVILLTGSKLSQKFEVHIHNEQCSDCLRFMAMYNGSHRDKYKTRPKHPSCTTGIWIIRKHLGLAGPNTLLVGRHRRLDMPESVIVTLPIPKVPLSEVA